MRNKIISRTAQAGHFKDKVKEARLRWLRRVQMRDSGCIGTRRLEVELKGQEVKRMTKEEMNGCGKKCRGPGEMEKDDSLRQFLEKDT